MRIRERAPDRLGRPLTAGARVKVLGEEGQPEGTVVRVLGDYGAVTVLLEKPTKAERMYRLDEVKVT
jgi:hypothetical protein